MTADRSGTITRLSMVVRYSTHPDGYLEQDEQGDWVDYADVAELTEHLLEHAMAAERECDRLRGLLEDARATLDGLTLSFERVEEEDT